jgi:hypothetical protein
MYQPIFCASWPNRNLNPPVCAADVWPCSHITLEILSIQPKSLPVFAKTSAHLQVPQILIGTNKTELFSPPTSISSAVTVVTMVAVTVLTDRLQIE